MAADGRSDCGGLSLSSWGYSRSLGGSGMGAAHVFASNHALGGGLDEAAVTSALCGSAEGQCRTTAM